MFKRLTSEALTVLLMLALVSSPAAPLAVRASARAAQAPAQSGGSGVGDRRAEKVKAKILKRGTGPDAHVRVTLRDRARVRGYVSEAGGDYFVVVGPRTGVKTTIPYSQVRSVDGKGLPEGAKAALFLGGTIGGLMLMAWAVARGTR
jgi:hypothetical protein